MSRDHRQTSTVLDQCQSASSKNTINTGYHSKNNLKKNRRELSPRNKRSLFSSGIFRQDLLRVIICLNGSQSLSELQQLITSLYPVTNVSVSVMRK